MDTYLFILMLSSVCYYENLIKLLKYLVYRTTTKFSGLKSISSKIFFYFSNIICFQVSLYNYKGKLSSFFVNKIFIELRFKDV